jgi:hypothetical protein
LYYRPHAGDGQPRLLPPERIDHYLADYPRRLGIPRSEFLALGRQNAGDEKEHFCMTILALRWPLRNSVSKLQAGELLMWRGWPRVPDGGSRSGRVTSSVTGPDLVRMNQLRPLPGRAGASQPTARSGSAPSRSPPRNLAHPRRRRSASLHSPGESARQLERRGHRVVSGVRRALDPDA